MDQDDSRTAREAGYVECAECGHPIEQHDTDGCQAVDGCRCPVRLTKTEIVSIRRRYGLPGRFNRNLLRP